MPRTQSRASSVALMCAKSATACLGMDLSVGGLPRVDIPIMALAYWYVRECGRILWRFCDSALEAETYFVWCEELNVCDDLEFCDSGWC